jgi:NAD(P)H-hydrate epimerase
MFDKSILKKLYIPASSSHKGQNGKLMIIGGSHLFHAAFLWSLTIASRIVDMVFYSSVAENNEIVQKAKEEFRDGIVVPRADIEKYIAEAECVLIGPGLPRMEGKTAQDDDTQTLTQHLLTTYPNKKWVVDGGSLQVISPALLPKGSVITPHTREFVKLFGIEATEESVKAMAEKYDIIIVAKSEKDIVCSKEQCVIIAGGNAGMTKGGTGDVLAGLIAALGCKNDLWLAAVVGSYFNKKAGEKLFEKVGYYFNASDLANEIPKVMKEELLV